MNERRAFIMCAYMQRHDMMVDGGCLIPIHLFGFVRSLARLKYMSHAPPIQLMFVKEKKIKSKNITCPLLYPLPSAPACLFLLVHTYNNAMSCSATRLSSTG